MRRLLFTGIGMFTLAGAAQADKVEVRALHICCGNCVRAVKNTLKKIDGVKSTSIDIKTKTLSFDAKDEKVAMAAVRSILQAGFYGSATLDGKPIKLDDIESSLPKAGEKTNEVRVKGIHLCCNGCLVAIKKLFKGSKISYRGAGREREITIHGKGLEKRKALKALRKAGFTGQVQ